VRAHFGLEIASRISWRVSFRRVDLTLSPAEEQFRDTLRAWIADNHPGREPEGDEASFAFRRDWQRALNDQGWAGLTWPAEYGGAGATQIEQAILFEEFARARAPQMANVLGLTMGGPTVIAHGTDEQKARFLSPILSADEIWCQGFSEPESGSDLASLKTRAVLDGDAYVVTGQKVWTTYAHHSKWCMLLARTNADAPKHRGLTYFLMDMEQDGVEIRPLVQITGEAEFNELFIEEARIPVENVVGGVDNGWRVAITTLMHERAGLAFALQARVQVALNELADELRGTKDPLIRQRFAQVAIEAQALRLLAFRGLTSAQHGGEPGPEGSLGKWLWADINQALTTLAMDARGPAAQVVDDTWTYRFLRARANSIEGGTTEILKNIVAERVLGLPRA
jgi:alkylation response protein AidB-like acyl-CoA dehydrogenase